MSISSKKTDYILSKGGAIYIEHLDKDSKNKYL